MSNIYEIRKISEFGKYIDFLSANKKELLICAAARDTLHKIDAKSMKKLRSIGMKKIIAGWVGYVYLSDQGVVQVDSCSGTQKSISESIDLDGLKVELVSRSFKDGNDSKIIVNNIDFSMNRRGLNVVVLDKQNMKLIDSVCFDYYPNTLTPFMRQACLYCPHMEEEKQKVRDTYLKRMLQLVHITDQWACVQENELSDMARLIEKFDEDYRTVSVVDEKGRFKKLINKYQFRKDFPRKDYRCEEKLYLEYDEDTERLKWKLADLFWNTPRSEIPILRDGKIVALGRRTFYFDTKGRWEPKQVHRIRWNLIDENVAREYFAVRKKILISSEHGVLKGFREAFSALVDIDVYKDDLLDKLVAREYDLVISASDVFQALSLEERQAYQVYAVLLSETIRRWFQERGVGLHYFSNEGRSPGKEKKFSNKLELIGGTIGYLREGEESYFIPGRNAYDNSLPEKQRQANYHAGRRCVKEAKSLTGNSIYFFGPCTAIGYATYSPDNTIESALQSKLNDENLDYHVINCGTEGVFHVSSMNALYRIMDTPVRSGDHIVVLMDPSGLWGKDAGAFPVRVRDLNEPFVAGDNGRNIYFVNDLLAHMNTAGYKIAAEYIFEKIRADLSSKITLKSGDVYQSFFSAHALPMSRNSVIDNWLNGLPQKKSLPSGAGAIIIRTDMLPNEYMYLIHEAFKRCSYLYVFLVEDKGTIRSIESMHEVLDMCTKDYPVCVLSLGKYAQDAYMWYMSVGWFMSKPPEEFDPVFDTHTFARYIAPRLGIRKYIVTGDESDKFERRYNILRREIISEEGLEWAEIPPRNTETAIDDYINLEKCREILCSTQDIAVYLDMLMILSGRCTIILAIKDTPGKNLSDGILACIHNLGFTNFSKKLWWMYIGFMDNGQVLYNKAGEAREKPVLLTAVVEGQGERFDISSKAWRKGNAAEIVINGVDYSANIRGLNIVVYDRVKHEVWDSIGYDAHPTRSRFVRKKIK